MTGTKHKKQWRMRNGDLIHVKDMDDDHLRNTVLMLRKNGFVHSKTYWAACTYAQTAPDGAAMAVDREIDNMKLSRRANYVFEEAERRGIK